MLGKNAVYFIIAIVRFLRAFLNLEVFKSFFPYNHEMNINAFIQKH